ncbi:MAG: DUF3160 domain-containing protein, partial [Deltaproteobacteria bacterium]|nr:DUF3160 domain-containing protein [Deltaproteobacteria bacterium]
ILVTPDAVLQVASDLLAAGIQEREMAMIVALRDLTEGIWTFARESLRAAPRDPVRRYLATWAAVPRILLGFAATRQAALEEEGGECILVQDMGCPEDMTELRAAWEAKLGRRLAEEEARLLGEVPDAIRDDVAGLLERVRGATGIGRYEPGALGQPQGFAVDWTLFTPRSHYTGPQFRDYFLAMSWYGNLPLPAHPLALQIADRILGDPVLGALWKDLDGFAGAAVGDPARPTLHHLAAARGAHPGWVKEVAAQDLLADLAARLGPIPVRGANETFGYPGMQPYLLPPRLGVDVGVLVRLTHPAVALRGMPSALDVLAALGNHLAEALSGAPPVGEGWTAGAFADALRTARDDLAGRGPGFWAENLYNRWMDMLRILADDAGIRGIATPRWAGSDLYRARLLTTALAGLSQIKHHTVLYNMNPMGVECDGGSPVVVLYEEPVLPPPPMAVEPHPEFYAAVAAFAAAADTALAAAPAPALDREEARSLLLETTWDPAGSLFRMPEGTFAGGPLGSFFQGLGLLAGFLEEASQRTLEGRPLEPEHQLLVQYLGGILERFVLRQDYLEDSMIRGADQGRTERGITLVTDIYHNPMRDQVLELGVGLVDRVYAVVPWLQGEGLVQGGMFSWYEFPEDGARRLTDQAWWERLQEGALPPRPPWSRLYLEEAE